MDNYQSIIQQFVTQFQSQLNADDWQRVIKEGIDYEQLQKVIRNQFSESITEQVREQKFNQSVVDNFSQLVGIAVENENQLAAKQLTEEAQEPSVEPKPSFDWKNVWNLSSLLPGKGKGSGPPSAMTNGSSISISFLVVVLMILWASFATVTTANGNKTTRLLLFTKVIFGNARVVGS